MALVARNTYASQIFFRIILNYNRPKPKANGVAGSNPRVSGDIGPGPGAWG